MKPDRETDKNRPQTFRIWHQLLTALASALLMASFMLPLGCSHEERIPKDAGDPERTHEQSMEQLEERREQ